MRERAEFSNRAFLAVFISIFVLMHAIDYLPKYRQFAKRLVPASFVLAAKNQTLAKVFQAKMTDQEELAKIAAESDDLDVINAAVTKLTDQALLLKVTMKAKSLSARRAALAKINDPKSLAKIAIRAYNCRPIRMDAVIKLTDQTELANVAVGSDDIDVIKRAMNKLTNETSVMNVAIRCKDQYGASQLALEKLQEQESLAKVTLEATRRDVRNAAILMVKDQEALAKVALNTKESDIRESAVRRLMDQAALAVAVEDLSRHVRIAAMRNLTNQTLLAKLAAEAKYHDVRIVAKHKLAKAGPLSKQ